MENLVVYVRHAESESNLILHNNKDKNLSSSQEKNLNSYHDPDITELGIKQSICTAQYILNKIKEMNKTKINVWMSPFQRAQDTAMYFIDLCYKENIEINFKIIVELQEYTSPKKVLSEQQTKQGLIIHDTKEIFIDKVIKFNDTLKTELKEHTKSDILIVFGHSLFFSNLFSYHINHEQFRPNERGSIRLPNCSISCESYNFDTLKWNTYVLSNIAHLPKEYVTGEDVPFGII
jgi:broad specificity phosphatase PhoE